MDWDPFADPADAEQTPETRQAVTSAPFATQHEVAWAPPPLQRPIRVACLHGTCSNGNVTKVQLQRAAKMCGDEVEFIYLDGRMPSDPSNIMYEEMSKNFKGQQFYDWAKWITESDDLETDVKKRKYRDLDVRLDSIQDLLRQHEPLDGVLGFSQGANMASLLAAQAVAGQGVNFGFVIHCCPAGPGWVNQRPDLFPAKLPMSPGPAPTTKRNSYLLTAEEVCISAAKRTPILCFHCSSCMKIQRAYRTAMATN
ncbi:unnamed protein product [Effrenium voratum]|nr:unnamed protein product [Effrenium voratum]